MASAEVTVTINARDLEEVKAEVATLRAALRLASHRLWEHHAIGLDMWKNGDVCCVCVPQGGVNVQKVIDDAMHARDDSSSNHTEKKP